MNDNPGERSVGHGQSGGLIVPDREIVGRGVDFETLGCLQFNAVVVACVQIHMDPAIFPRGDRLNERAVHPTDFKGDAGDALGFIAGADLNQLQSADRCVVEGQGLGLTLLDFN